MPDTVPKVQAAKPPTESIRPDIAKIVGLDLEKITEITKQRAQEAEAVRICKNNASETYDQLRAGQEVVSINLGIGQFDLSPTDNTHDLLPNLKKRTQEINPPPPHEPVNIWLGRYASKALDDKEFDVAVACYNYITNENLNAKENTHYLEELAAAATTPDEKYDLYLALQQVIQAPPETPSESIGKSQETTPTSPNDTIPTTSPTAKDKTTAGNNMQIEPSPPGELPETVNTAQPGIKESDEAAAPIGIPTRQPLTETTIPTTAIQGNPAAESPTPEAQATSQPLPKPEPINIGGIPTTPTTDTRPQGTITTPNLRPVPPIDEARAQGLIDEIAPIIAASPPPSTSEAELAKAA